jgi:hypothetical protein
MVKRNVLILLAPLTALVIWVVWPKSAPALKHVPPLRKSLYRTEEAKHAEAKRRQADQLYRSDPRAAREQYAAFVAEHKQDPNPEVQDEVGAARLRLGYLETKINGFAAAHAVFKEAEREYRGTGTMSAEFGGIADQGAYQAAVCLAAEGNKAEAEAAFLAFMSDYTKSPLIFAAHKRLLRLDPSKRQAYDQALSLAREKQEKDLRMALAMCGPLSIAYLQDPTSSPDPDRLKTLAKLCGTTEGGTTMQGMQDALQSLGFKPSAMLLNRKDFASLQTPAIWLLEGHYLVLERMSASRADVYDPLLRSRRAIALPSLADTQFSASVLIIQVKS